MRVELLYFDGCPNWPRAREELNAVIAELGLGVQPKLVRVPDEQTAKQLRFVGSPTVRINGQDIDQNASAGGYALGCRVYWHEGHAEGVPPREWLVAALERSRFARHYEQSTLVSAAAQDVFAFVDDHAHLSSHMSRSSWLMGGGRMEVTLDDRHGQQVGSHIRLRGKVFGISLFLDEVVTRHDPPRTKTWETVGDLRLLVIGHYCMRIEVETRSVASLLRVAIDYNLPASHAWLGRLFGRLYARWCVRQMLNAVRAHFNAQTAGSI